MIPHHSSSNSRSNNLIPDLKALLDAAPPLRKPNTTKKPTVPSKLQLSEACREAILEHIDTVGLDCYRYTHDVEDQNRAYQKLEELLLHIPNEIPRDVRTKYSIRTSDSKPLMPRTGPAAALGSYQPKYMRSTRLYQCLCGTTTGAATREIGWDNLDCPSFIRLVTTDDVADSQNPRLLSIDEISGILYHSDACLDTHQMSRDPHIPLEPRLREYALDLLRAQIPLTQLQHLCRQWALEHLGNAAGDNHYRYMLSDHESTSLYRTIARENGVPQRTTAEDNLFHWFHADNPHPPYPILSESCIFYQPHFSSETERFALIISTPKQRKMAWEFGHKRQIIMDGTFGISSARVLLFILMVIDDKNKGVPIAQILFTARDEARAVHADYNSKLLTDLLGRWKAGMGKNVLGEEFTPSVAITDNNTRERFALKATWENIFLILCRFHTWQAWRNGLNRALCRVPKDEQPSLRRRLASFLMKLLKDITKYEPAIMLYNKELSYFTKLKQTASNSLTRTKATGSLKFLAYLQDYLKSEAWWLSWSPGGVVEAALCMNIIPSQVAKTTNYLESFNGRLKQKLFRPYQHNGRLPRLDIWVMLLVTRVLPDFFDRRDDRIQQQEYQHAMRNGLFGPEHARNSSVSDSSSNSSVSSELDPLDKWDEETMIYEMTAEFSVLKSEEPPDDDLADESHSFSGLELKISDEVADPASGIMDKEPDFPMWDEEALDAADILCNLKIDLPLDPPSQNTTGDDDNNKATLPPPMPPMLPPPPPADRSISGRCSDLEAIALQDVLAAEDALLLAVQKALTVTTNPKILDAHISENLRHRLTGAPDPLPLAAKSCRSPCSDDEKNMKLATSTKAKKLKQLKLEPFLLQTKESRKPSYRFR